MSQPPQNICPLCNTQVNANLHGMRLDCGHWVHTKCLDKKNPNFEQCKDNCEGVAAINNKERTELSEENSYNGHDYVADPKDPTTLTAIRQRFMGSEPAHLLAFGPQKCPIEWLIKDKDYGLQRLLAEGIDIEDFLSNGYSWDDLKKFKDVQLRPKDALYAMHMNAEHLRDYAHLLPIKDMQITGREIVELYGFYFPEDSDAAQVTNGKNLKRWTAADLVQLGMKVHDLFGADMKWFEQYEHLTPTDADEEALGVKDEHIDALESFNPPPPLPVTIVNHSSSSPSPVVEVKIVNKPTKPVSFNNSKASYNNRRLHGLKKK